MDEVNDITFAFTLLNDGIPTDLTGTTLTLAVHTPNQASLSKPCTIINATAGEFSVLLDHEMYAVAGDYSAQVYWYNLDEINITDKVYYESIHDIAI
jgi:hypothetical protein